jgi:uncharacterized protein
MRTAMMGARIGSAELADLVARGTTLDFSFPVTSLARLAALAPAAGTPWAGTVGSACLKTGFTFQAGAEGFPQLRLVVEGMLPLVCQRCLELLEWPVNVDVTLTMVRGDAEAAILTDPFDTVLLADEVLAALPLAPKHSGATRCGSAAGREDKVQSGEMHRPMAGLADLLGRGDRQGDK